MADKSVEDHLDSWGLSKYKEKFKEEGITLDALFVLTKDHINGLVNTIGERALLEAHIQGLKEAIGNKEDHHTETFDIPIAENVQDISLTNLLNEEFNTIIVPSSSGTNINTILQSEPPQNADIENLRRYLLSINEGKALLINYEESGLLDNTARRRLCNIIINRELQNSPDAKITSERFYKLAYDIVKIFKKESTSVYFTPYVSISPTHKTAAKGKLLDTFRQRRRQFSRCGLINTRKRKYSSSSSNCSSSATIACRSLEAAKNLPEPTDIAKELEEDNLKWLKNSCDPWVKVQLYWEQTRKARFQKYADNMIIADYFNEFRALGQPGGYHLLLSDFNHLYSDNTDKLLENWPLYREKILEAAKKKTDPALKEILHSLENDDVCNDTINTAAFMSLAFLMATSTIRKPKGKKQWRPSKLETLQGFITHIKSPADLEATISLKKEKMTSLGYTIQPYIVIIGTSIADIHTRYIVINNVKYSSTSDVRYESTSILYAVDTCFKILFALNAEYPSESSNIWYFIQKGLYKLTTKYDKVYTSVNTLMTDLGITP